MCGRVQLAQERTERGDDIQLDRAGYPGVNVSEQVPDAAFCQLEASDLCLAAGPYQRATIRRLSAAARKERRGSQQHPAGLGIQHRILGDEDVRMVMVESHAVILRPSAQLVLAKIAPRR